MTRKKIFGMILVLTCFAIIFVIIFKFSIRYNKLIISEEKWNNIISNRNKSISINFESIEFNDYHLFIDNKNSVIYYSIVNSNKKYNPSVQYKTNEKVNIAVNENIKEDIVDQDNLKIMLYNDSEYRIYSLVVTHYPILNVTYQGEYNAKKMDMELEIFDNHVDSPIRVLKSRGILKVIEEDKEYCFSLKKESLGHNQRENHISIFGMEKRDEYLIKLADKRPGEYVRFFINGEYKGIYSFGPKEGRINRFERNKENNR